VEVLGRLWVLGRPVVLDRGLFGRADFMVRELRLPKDLPPDIPRRARASEGMVQARNISKNQMLKNLTSQVFFSDIPCPPASISRE